MDGESAFCFKRIGRRMDMSNLFKVCMFVTSFIPLWVSIFFIEVMSLIEKTKYKSDGIGGIKSKGMMISVYPRKE